MHCILCAVFWDTRLGSAWQNQTGPWKGHVLAQALITSVENPANPKQFGLSQAAYLPIIHAHSMGTRLGMFMVATRQDIDRTCSGRDPKACSGARQWTKKLRATHTQTLAVCLPPSAPPTPDVPASHKTNSQTWAHQGWWFYHSSTWGTDQLKKIRHICKNFPSCTHDLGHQAWVFTGRIRLDLGRAMI